MAVTRLGLGGFARGAYQDIAAKPPPAAVVFASLDVSPFLYVAAEYGAAVSHFFQVFLRATVGTVYARLFDVTADAEVASSEVSTTSATHVRLRTGSLTLVDGNEYVPQFGLEGSDAGKKKSARMLHY